MKKREIQANKQGKKLSDKQRKRPIDKSKRVLNTNQGRRASINVMREEQEVDARLHGKVILLFSNW